MSDYQQTGYLNTDFRMFHLTDTRLKPIAFHYHDFHKILIVLKGSVSYCVEADMIRRSFAAFQKLIDQYK